MRKYLGVDVTDPELYHLIMNNQLLPLEEQAGIVVQLVREKCRAVV